jgi:hypothetical protein
MKVAELWLDKIKSCFTVNDDIIESYTEYFLVVSNSISDYIINDFLDSVEPRLTMINRSDIIRNKTLCRYDGTPITHKENKKIQDFLDFHKDKVKDFKKTLLVQYFIALRNWIVHTVTPHIYDNQYGDNNEIKDRRFQRHFVYYLLLNNGGKLLLENGGSLLLESSNFDSFFDAYPLSKLEKPERTELENILSTRNPIEVMSEYLNHIRKLVEDFESYEPTLYKENNEP